MTSSSIGIQIEAAITDFQWHQGEYVRLLNDPVLGNLVRRGIRVMNQAKRNASQTPPSQPGHGPAVRTGRLRGSITYRIGHDQGEPYVDIGTAVFYAPFVELGTSRMAARPFLRPALEAARTT